MKKWDGRFSVLFLFWAVNQVKIRKAGKSDIELLCETRKKQLLDEGLSDTRDMDGELRRFFDRRIADGSLSQFILEEDGKFVSTAAIIYYDFPPSWSNESGLRGYIANVYTVPEKRGMGYATRVLSAVLDEARERNVTSFWLGASRQGRPVYEKLGFHESDELMDMKL